MEHLGNEKINLLVTVDDGFFKYLLVCLKSILDNTMHSVILYVTNRLSEKNLSYLKSINPRISLVILADAIIKKSNSVYKGTKRWSSTVCDRIFAPFYIDGIDRLLYLDVDTVVICDLAKLYHFDLKGKTIGASGFSYFNSGVILYNIKQLKEKYNYLNNETGFKLDSCDYPDQDYLNKIFKNDFCDIGFFYNYRAHNTFLWKNPKKHGGGVIHYLGKIKPDSYKWIEYKANKPFWKYAKNIYGRKYRFITAIKSVAWYPVAIYRRFRYHTGRDK